MVAPPAGGSLLPWQRTPTTNPFLTNSKKIRRSKRATNTHKHGRGSYLSDGTRGDSKSHVEPEPLRSKDIGLFTYNIEKMTLFVPKWRGPTQPNRMIPSMTRYAAATRSRRCPRESEPLACLKFESEQRVIFPLATVAMA